MVSCPRIWKVPVNEGRHENDAGNLAAGIPMVRVKPSARCREPSRAWSWLPALSTTIVPVPGQARRDDCEAGIEAGTGVIAGKVNGHRLALISEGRGIVIGKECICLAGGYREHHPLDKDPH